MTIPTGLISETSPKSLLDKFSILDISFSTDSTNLAPIVIISARLVSETSPIGQVPTIGHGLSESGLYFELAGDSCR